MQSTLDQSGGEHLWLQLAPHLEAAMSRLRVADRELLALRFYENKTGAQAATQLGIRDEAARKRTHRALEILRSYFARRGVDSTAADIGESISANSIQVAPVALAKTVSGLAIAKGATASSSTLALVKGSFKLMTWAQIQFACGVGGAILFGSAITLVAAKRHHGAPEPYGATYVLEGELYHTFNGTGRTLDDRHKPFIAVVSGTNWWIQTKGIKPTVLPADSEELKRLLPPGMQIFGLGSAKVAFGPDGNTAFAQWGSTGGLLYVKEISNSRDSSEVSETTFVGKPIPVCSEYIAIYNNISAPVFNHDLCFPVWLAVCSSQYFHKEQMQSPPLIWDSFLPTDSHGNEFTVTSKRKVEAAVSFMEEVEFNNEGYSGFHDQESHKYVVQELAEKKPYLEARYFVSSWQNSGELTHPQTTCFDIYPQPRGSDGSPPPAIMKIMIPDFPYTLYTTMLLTYNGAA
jgi:hypothetical protein